MAYKRIDIYVYKKMVRYLDDQTDEQIANTIYLQMDLKLDKYIVKLIDRHKNRLTDGQID